MDSRSQVKLNVLRLGRLPYLAGIKRQEQCWLERRAGQIADTLLLLEHPPVITLGVRKESGRDVLLSEAELRRRGIELHQADRGGLATLHLPGQLVGYLIVEVRRIPGGLRGLIDRIERGLIETCAAFGVHAVAGAAEPGVWVRRGAAELKLASLGLAVRSGVSKHGFGLNVNPDLALFAALRSCGHPAESMTSLAAQAGVPVTWEAALEQVEQSFRAIFAATPAAASAPERGASAKREPPDSAAASEPRP